MSVNPNQLQRHFQDVLLGILLQSLFTVWCGPSTCLSKSCTSYIYVIVMSLLIIIGGNITVVTVFSQLFGEPDADEDVSPDTEDPEASGSSSEPNQPIHRVSTREWVSSCNYHPDKLFQKVWTNVYELLNASKICSFLMMTLSIC